MCKWTGKQIIYRQIIEIGHQGLTLKLKTKYWNTTNIKLQYVNSNFGGEYLVSKKKKKWKYLNCKLKILQKN